MPIIEINDWLAVIRADEVQRRLERQADYKYASPFDKQGAGQANAERDGMIQEFRALMMREDNYMANRKKFKKDMGLGG